MTKQDIRNAYTQKVAELLAKGYSIFPDTMGGSQGEIAHIDLTNGSEILRVLLERGLCWDRLEDGYNGEMVKLTVGRAAPDTRIYNWDGTVWNNRLEKISEIKWAEIGARRRPDGNGWYTTIEEGVRISKIQMERYRNREAHRRETLDGAYKSAALRWLRKQPKMKSCRPDEIEKVERVWDDDGRRHFEIKARGKYYRLGR